MKFLLSLYLLTLLNHHCYGAPLTIVTEHLPPLQIVKNNRVVGGLATEVVQALLQQTGDKAQIHPHTWARSFKIALEQPNVLIYSIARNQTREKQFKWVGLILTLDNYLWRLKSRDDIAIDSLEGAKAFRIGVPRNDIQHQFFVKNGFNSREHLMVVNRHAQAIRMLFKGRIDLIYGSKLLVAERLLALNKTIDDLKPAYNTGKKLGGLHIAFSHQTDDSLVDKYSQALAVIKANGSYAAILHSWADKLNIDQTNNDHK